MDSTVCPLDVLKHFLGVLWGTLGKLKAAGTIFQSVVVCLLLLVWSNTYSISPGLDVCCVSDPRITAHYLLWLEIVLAATNFLVYSIYSDAICTVGGCLHAFSLLLSQGDV